ncbi:unnamed protein product [Ambrosiozyma monospora]|uniref:2-dehydropantolactone reductase n=1 Tax=Ambrosiozyma monospora TaxID=43982 RepID=A0A9W6Z042_AMBMO|nr:unnamed protein product [Ambrosiozyma monospora]
MTIQTTITIPNSNNVQIPIIGFGSGTKWQWKKKQGERVYGQELNKFKEIVDEDLVEATITALKHGIVHLDTAEIYTTRKDIGEAIKRSGISRETLFITDKYFSRAAGSDGKLRGPYESAKEALELTGLKYLDLFLLHGEDQNENYTVESSWKELERLVDEGLVRAIGVSNHTVKRLQEIAKIARIKPSVNQIEFHPYLQNQSTGIIEYAEKNDILIEAYGPLTPIVRAKGGPLDSVLDSLAEKYGKTTSQILLKWVHKHGFVTVTTTSNEKRLDEILDVVNFDLDDADFETITKVGNSHFFRAFPIPPLPDYDEELKRERGLI